MAIKQPFLGKGNGWKGSIMSSEINKVHIETNYTRTGLNISGNRSFLILLVPKKISISTLCTSSSCPFMNHICSGDSVNFDKQEMKEKWLSTV